MEVVCWSDNENSDSAKKLVRRCILHQLNDAVLENSYREINGVTDLLAKYALNSNVLRCKYLLAGTPFPGKASSS